MAMRFDQARAALRSAAEDHLGGGGRRRVLGIRSHRGKDYVRGQFTD